MRGPMVPEYIPGSRTIEAGLFWFHDLYSRIIVLAVAYEMEKRAKELTVDPSDG